MPYLAGIMDAVHEPGVEEIVFVKPTQVGFSEATRNILGYWIDQDPGPCMLVMPSEQSARETIEERITPLIFDTPRLREHVSSNPRDTKKSAVHLDTMSIYVGWSGSPQSLASRPNRFLLLDEVDKYPAFSGREANPIALARKRLETYGYRARMFIGSTPTTRDGNILQAWDRCGDQRYFWVPCPHCKWFQRLVWPQVRWPKTGEDRARAAEDIQSKNLAYYECSHCQKPIYDRHKTSMLMLGVWVGSDQVVNDRGEVIGQKTNARRIGFHLNAIYSPWVKFSKLAAEFVLAQGSPSDLMDFRNSRMAEPFEVRVKFNAPTIIREKSERSHEMGVIPQWAGIVLATADTQTDRFYYVIRAWGPKYRSRLIKVGVVSTKDLLKKECLDATFPIEDRGDLVAPFRLMIDTQGDRASEMYAFCRSDPNRIIGIKGSSVDGGRPYKRSSKAQGFEFGIVNTSSCKDHLFNLIHDDDQELWMPYRDVSNDYVSQMSSEHKVFDRRRNKEIWEKVTSGASNHYLDCEAYQIALAYKMGVDRMDEVDTYGHEYKSSSSSGTEANGDDWASSYKGRW